jgi:hypothetical protein
MLSVDEQVGPVTRIPLKHSTNTVGGPGNTVPVRSAPAGLRIVRSANRVTSKPFKAVEFWMNTETRTCVPTVPVIDAGLDGQADALVGIMHTMPVDAPCAGVEFTAANKTVPINMRIDAEAKVIFFKNYTRICGLHKKTVRLRFVAFPLRQAPSYVPYTYGSLQQAGDSVKIPLSGGRVALRGSYRWADAPLGELRKRRENSRPVLRLTGNSYADVDRVRGRPTRPDYRNCVASRGTVPYRRDGEDTGATATCGYSYAVRA